MTPNINILRAQGVYRRRYAGSQIFPCILYEDGCGAPMYFVWRRLARVPKIPMYFAWSGWRHKVWKRPSPGKSGQDHRRIEGATHEHALCRYTATVSRLRRPSASRTRSAQRGGGAGC